MTGRKRGRRYKRNIKHFARKVVFIGTHAPYIWGTTRKEGRKMENRKNFDGVELSGNYFPVVEIEKGHMRLAHKEESDGIIVCFCVAEEYGEPGTVANDKHQPVPVFGLKLWGTKSARLIAEGLIAIADDIDERRQNERS